MKLLLVSLLIVFLGISISIYIALKNADSDDLIGTEEFVYDGDGPSAPSSTTSSAASSTSSSLDSLATQLSMNAASSKRWAAFESHRIQVTALLEGMRMEVEEDWKRKREEAIQQQEQAEIEASLCLLGAGNLNDVELRRLLPEEKTKQDKAAEVGSEAGASTASSSSDPTSTPRYTTLSLIDIDTSSMHSGVARHIQYHNLTTSASKLIQYYETDVTGAFDVFDQWREESAVYHQQPQNRLRITKDNQILLHPYPSDEVLNEWIRTRMKIQTPFFRPAGMPISTRTYDVVASICLLSQLQDSLKSALYSACMHTSESSVGKTHELTMCVRHPLFVKALNAIQEHHMALLLDLMKPGGYGLLITDVITGNKIRQINDMESGEDLEKLLDALVKGTSGDELDRLGTNPARIQRLLLPGGALEHLVEPESVVMTQPWKWNFGGADKKTFLVTAVVFQKRKQEGEERQ